MLAAFDGCDLGREATCACLPAPMQSAGRMQYAPTVVALHDDHDPMEVIGHHDESIEHNVWTEQARVQPFFGHALSTLVDDHPPLTVWYGRVMPVVSCGLM
jgi:hypothetical protein